MRTYIYVDGFNLYYGCLKGSQYKWLDLKKLCQNLLKPENQIVKIKYFTASVSGKFDPDQPIRQKTYLRALECFTPEIEIYKGHFLTHPVDMPTVTPPPPKVKVYKTEEKGSDVNLAVHLLNDAWHNVYDCAIIISNDSDLSESTRLVKEERQKTIGLICPSSKPSKQLVQCCDFVKKIRSHVLANAQLPNPIPNTNLTKPKSW
jgi:uncharacterized LabA/DUF88 family protein